MSWKLSAALGLPKGSRRCQLKTAFTHYWFSQLSCQLLGAEFWERVSESGWRNLSKFEPQNEDEMKKMMKFKISSKFWSISIFQLLDWFKLREYRRKGPGKPRVIFLVLVSAFTKLVFSKIHHVELMQFFTRISKMSKALKSEPNWQNYKLEEFLLEIHANRYRPHKTYFFQHDSMQFFIRISKLSKVSNSEKNWPSI